MIIHPYIKTIIVLLLSGIGLISCKSLSKVELIENPGFANNAEEYTLTHGFPKELVFDLNLYQEREQTFFIDNIKTNNRYKIEAEYLSTTLELELVKKLKLKQEDETTEEITKIFFHKTDSLDILREKDTVLIRGYNKENYFYYGMTFYNPLNDQNYTVLSKIHIYLDRLEINPESYTVNDMILFPIQFWIFEEHKEVGSFSFKKSMEMVTDYSFAYTTEIYFNDKWWNTKSQGSSYKKHVTIDHEDQLMAVFELKPPKPGAGREGYQELTGKVIP